MANTGKIAEVFFENALETYEHQMQLVNNVSYFEPDAATMQNANNFVWRPVQHHAPIIEGWDLTGQEQDIIEETYPAILGTPKNDFVQQRADNLRDITFWERRGKQSGMQQATELNQTIAEAIRTQGSLFYRGSTSANGYEFIGEAQAIMNERQGMNMGRHFVLNDRDTLSLAGDLSNRETVKGRPETAWQTGQIGSQVAQFDVYTGSYLPNLAGGSSPDTTVTGNQSFRPQGGTVNATTGVVTNVDYRSATIPVTDSSGYAVGDKVKFTNGSNDVQAVGLADKTETGQAMTFTIVAKPNATSVTVYPKPIAADDSALTTTEQAYANVDTTIANGAVMTRLNTDTSAKTNLFWDQDAVEVLGGNIPADLFQQFNGQKVISETLSNGLNMYMIYDANMDTMNFRYRCFIWYGITIKDPSRCGVAVRGSGS